MDVKLTRDADKLDCVLYNDYLSRRKGGESKERAKTFMPDWERRLLPDENVDNVASTFRELCGKLPPARLYQKNSFIMSADFIIYMENRFSNGKRQKAKDNCMLIVHTRAGKHFSKSSWGKLWNSYMLDLNVKYGYNGNVSKYSPRSAQMLIKPFTPQQLRHAFCTMLYAAGYSLLEARDQMGHSDIQTTANIYTHLNKLDGRKKKGKLTKYLCKYDASKSDETTEQNNT